MTEELFAGFEPANTTPVPDILFDRLLTRLAGSELKVILYIIRRTYGFKKTFDAISSSQFEHGITTKDGTVLDEGCGLSDRKAIKRALDSLVEKGFILRTPSISSAGDFDPNVYQIRFKGGSKVGAKKTPPSVKTPGGVGAKTPPRVGAKTPPGVGAKTPHTRNSNTTNSNTTNSNHTMYDCEAASADLTAFLHLAEKLGLSSEKVTKMLESQKESDETLNEEEVGPPALVPEKVPPVIATKKPAKSPKAAKPVQQTLQIELTAKEQEFWNLWCSLWFNSDIPPNLSETAYKHVVKLAPYIDTKEQLESLSVFSRKELEAKGIKAKGIQLGNLIHSYPGWKQTQQETSSTNNNQSSLPEEEEEINIHEKKEYIRFIKNNPQFLVEHPDLAKMPRYAFLFNNDTIPVGV